MPKYWGKQIFTHGSFPEVKSKKNAKNITFFFVKKSKLPKKNIFFAYIF